jgi:hypothetical protein
MEPNEIIKRKQAAASERARYEDLFDDCIRLTMPARKRFHNVGGVDRAEDIFDETGANGVQEFVSRMQAGLFPSFSQFVKSEASSAVDPKDRAAVNRDLEEIDKFAFEEIWNSNFAQESAESLNDLAISTGLMLVEDSGRADTALINRSVPITEMLLEKGPDDSIGGMFRVSKVKASLIPARYPRADLDNAPETKKAGDQEADKELTIIEYTRRDFSKAGEAWDHFVVCEEYKETLDTRNLSGVGSGPFIPFRWTTAAGETWGRGPLLGAIAAIRTTNLMVELVLENAAMNIVGVYQTDNEGVINSDQVNLLPGTIMTREIGTRGLEQVNTATGNFNMRDVVLNDQRLNIKRALFNDMLSDPNKTPATATEVAERMADLAHRTSSGFARVFYEFIVPYYRRVLHILEQRGDIELPVKNGRPISFTAVSPLAQAQRSRSVQTLMQDFQVRASMVGPQAAQAAYDQEFMHEWLIEQIGLDTRLYKSAGDMKAALEAGLEAQAQTTLIQEGMKRGD